MTQDEINVLHDLPAISRGLVTCPITDTCYKYLLHRATPDEIRIALQHCDKYPAGKKEQIKLIKLKLGG